MWVGGKLPPAALLSLRSIMACMNCRYALSPMAKLMKTGIGAGKGLVALDGAAQAGIIRARVAQLPTLQAVCIVARYAPRFEEFPCCRNKDKMTDDFRGAIVTLAE